MIEHICLKCDETAVNVEKGDPHFERQDGTPCGGELVIHSKWFASAADVPSRKAINWDGLSHC